MCITIKPLAFSLLMMAGSTPMIARTVVLDIIGKHQATMGLWHILS